MKFPGHVIVPQLQHTFSTQFVVVMTHDVYCDVLGFAIKAFARAFLITIFQVRGSKVLLQKQYYMPKQSLFWRMVCECVNSHGNLYFFTAGFFHVSILSLGFLNCFMFSPNLYNVPCQMKTNHQFSPRGGKWSRSQSRMVFQRHMTKSRGTF